MTKQTAPEMLSAAARALKPETTLDACNALSDIADLIKRIRTRHMSQDCVLNLPDGTDADLLIAQEAVFAALRKIEAVLVTEA